MPVYDVNFNYTAIESGTERVEANNAEDAVQEAERYVREIYVAPWDGGGEIKDFEVTKVEEVIEE